VLSTASTLLGLGNMVRQCLGARHEMMGMRRVGALAVWCRQLERQRLCGSLSTSLLGGSIEVVASVACARGAP
jgi:hypothetical protein